MNRCDKRDAKESYTLGAVPLAIAHENIGVRAVQALHSRC